ncbi:hypothetical protein ABW20_dc0108420 [Dactylellina cionopaga]|nr:hypothetical protein ABW20_dc0108420 [Dactylellina cionopaga]
MFSSQSCTIDNGTSSAREAKRVSFESELDNLDPNNPGSLLSNEDGKTRKLRKKMLKKANKEGKQKDKSGCKPFEGCSKGLKERAGRWKTKLKALRKMKNKRKIRKGVMRVFRSEDA